ncbi:LysE family transporter [Paenibacillus sp. FSL W8-0186]|uniref:Amino acid efflux protein YcgF n=1 Tax=Paenibacillus woosongensis TaxID=307580 RepID=A0ABQ4MX35_9BACL|nr:LysE family transporter [Paenibacillus woosongensis]GIP60479.1 putative amino acid efflux protein YcgF [Paenibacillus woosongensis]
MSLFVSYILLGLSLAAPIGPINAAQMDRGIRGGFWNSWVLGLGSLCADFIFIGLVYFGTVHFLQVPFVKTFLWLFGSFVLLYSGWEGLRGAREIAEYRNARQESLYKSFGAGFFLSISNPLSIMFWLGIYGSILAKAAQTYGTKELVLYTSAVVMGLVIWDLTMAAMSSGFRRLLTPRLLTGISVLSGLSLIVFGFYFGWQACLELFG